MESELRVKDEAESYQVKKMKLRENKSSFTFSLHVLFNLHEFKLMEVSLAEYIVASIIKSM